MIALMALYLFMAVVVLKILWMSILPKKTNEHHTKVCCLAVLMAAFWPATFVGAMLFLLAVSIPWRRKVRGKK